jgi:hypothetical protein
LCISRNKKKELDSKFGIGMEHLNDNPDPSCSSGACPELFWDDDSFLGRDLSTLEVNMGTMINFK